MISAFNVIYYFEMPSYVPPPYGFTVVPVISPERLIFQEEVRIKIFKDAFIV